MNLRVKTFDLRNEPGAESLLKNLSITKMREEIKKRAEEWDQWNWSLGVAPSVECPLVTADHPAAMTGADADADRAYREGRFVDRPLRLGLRDRGWADLRRPRGAARALGRTGGRDSPRDVCARDEAAFRTAQAPRHDMGRRGRGPPEPLRSGPTPPELEHGTAPAGALEQAPTSAPAHRGEDGREHGASPGAPPRTSLCRAPCGVPASPMGAIGLAQADMKLLTSLARPRAPRGIASASLTLAAASPAA